MSGCEYDVAVVGAGPGGYKCAIKAAKLGLKVACIDKNLLLGGTCLRVGCIPSKALLDYSYKYYAAKKLFSDFGVVVGDVSYDLNKMMDYRDKEIAALSAGINGLLRSAGVKLFIGVAKVIGKKGDLFEVSVTDEKGVATVLCAKNVVLATGSKPSLLPNIDVNEKDVMSSDGALSMDVPKRLMVIGGGAIGLEMSSIWSRLGAKVTVVEYCNRIAANSDSEVSKALLSSLEKQGISFHLEKKVLSLERSSGGLTVKCESVTGGDILDLEVDKVLVAVGRKPEAHDLVSNVGQELKLDERGFVLVNNRYETNIKGLYAIGDVIGGAMLAHKAEIEGHAVAETLSGGTSYVDYGVIPSVIYTHPGAASVGRSEDSLKEIGYKYKVGKSNFAANGRARITGESEGFVKVLACSETDTLLGVHIVGTYADTMINEAAVALGFRATAKDICCICHSHPDVNEAFRDACEVAYHKK